MMREFQAEVVVGDCIEVMRTMPADSVDAVVTDPPYGLEFMGKEWDGANGFRRSLNPADVGRDNAFGRASRTGPEYRAGTLFQQWCELWATEALRVLKPGGHLLAFGGTRTWHRLAVAVEDAGFEIRDSIAWLYGSGFPKSLDVSKAIDKAAGAERSGPIDSLRTRGTSGGFQVAVRCGTCGLTRNGTSCLCPVTAPATEAAQQWAGFGTSLKPAFEPCIVARKPIRGTVAANVQQFGTGALNIDATRIGMSDFDRNKIDQMGGFGSAGWAPSAEAQAAGVLEGRADGSLASLGAKAHPAGRWPANVVLDEDQAAALDEQSGTGISRKGKPRGSAEPGEGWGMTATGAEYDDSGGASRFFLKVEQDDPRPAKMSKWSKSSAASVASFFATIRATIANFVPTNAEGFPDAPSDLLARCAEILADSAGTSIAHDLVAIKTLNSGGGLLHSLASTTDSSISTPILSLAYVVEAWDSTGTIPTMTSLMRLFGCASHAIESSISSGSLESVSDTFQIQSRFRYTAKAPKKERPAVDGVAHPTVKPLKLMRWLVRLVTPPGGVVLDPFAGSGATVEAAILEGFDVIGIEKDDHYPKLIAERLMRTPPRSLQIRRHRSSVPEGDGRG